MESKRKPRGGRANVGPSRVSNFSITPGELAGKLPLESGHADSVARHP
jgi:hypothetical protein